MKLTVASDTDTVGKEITISGLASKADVVKGLTFTASALADGATSLTHTAQLGDSIGILAAISRTATPTIPTTSLLPLMLEATSVSSWMTIWLLALRILAWMVV